MIASSPVTRLQTMPSHIPARPGVYLMKDAGGAVLYVGKATHLRARVRSYFGSDVGDRPRVPALMELVASVEVVVTESEREALILENTLIKKFQPRFNVALKDDKTWLSIRISVQERWPRVSLIRRWRKDGARYFGPYLNGVRTREVERLIRGAFALRTCTDGVFRAHAKRPCILFNMGNCVAPCADRIDPGDYDERVEQVLQLLQGRNRSLVTKLRSDMHAAAAELRFEEAAELRDRVRLIERIAERQRVHRAAGEDRDVFALFRTGDVVTVAMLPVRDGKVEDPQSFTFTEVVTEDAGVLEQVALQLYGRGVTPAPELLMQVMPPEPDALAALLREQAGRAVRIRVPRRGPAHKLLEMARENARLRHEAAGEERRQLERAVIELRRRLRLEDLPRRIECFDISHSSGTDTVASMVLFEDGKPFKNGYRSFTIRDVDGVDDYAAMREVMLRRLRRTEKGWSLPDLLLVDGGKGQLGAAASAASEVGLQVPLAALAKPDAGELERDPGAPDKVFLPGRKNPVRLPAHSAGMHLLQRVRDEAHRFAVHHHRRKRRKRTLGSALESIPGVGPKRRRALLRHFGSLRAVRAAAPDQIAEVPGIGRALAEEIAAASGSADTDGEPT